MSNSYTLRARRQLDAARIEQNINYLDSINVQLDVDVKERIESDQIIDKITATRLDAMQRLLVRQVGHEKYCVVSVTQSRVHRVSSHAQVEVGINALRAELQEAEERLRVATERLYQQDVDAAIRLRQMKQVANLQRFRTYFHDPIGCDV